MKVGNMGVKGRYELPKNFIGVHWLPALIIIISLIGSMVLLLVFIGQKNDESYKRFIESAVKDCKQVTVGHLLITPTKDCSEKNRTAIISYDFTSLQTGKERRQ